MRSFSRRFTLGARPSSYAVLAALLAVTTGLSASGQLPDLSPAGTAQVPSSGPTFRAGVNAVVVDVRVVDASGRFVSDLQKEDFRIRWKAL